MRITNIRVLNNYKVKLINAKFSGVNPFESAFNDQGTRPPSDFPTIITTPPDPEFQEKFNRVFNYLINRYEPGWSAATADLGKAATMELLGISAPINPLILGGTVEASFNYTTNGDDGWFDILTHPRDFASAVRTAYKKFDRARSPRKASNKFIQYNLNGIYSQDYLFDGGNAFFGFHPKFDWYPGNSLPSQLYMGLSANYDNCIRRSIIHSPYGNFSSPMNSLAGNWRRYPWLSDRYTGESFQFDMYLLLRENTTIRDLLNADPFDGRSAELGVIVNSVTDAYLNTSYKGTCFAAGLISRVPFNDYGRTGGGYSADQVLVGSPWIRYPEALTYSSWWGQANERAGLCFAYETLTLFNGMTFPDSPQDLRELAFKPPMTDVVGISYGYGNRLLQSLDDLSAAWGNSMEFIAYLGCLPYGTGFEMRIPFGLYRDPTVEGNKEYFKWRLDASVSHWKEKFKSPFDGFAHVFMDASAVIERTFHQWQAPGYTLWTNIASSGASYVENIPVEWARDQYNYTFGDSGPDAANGVVLGVETFAQYMFKDDVGLLYPNRNDQRRFAGDTNPRHWCLDDDKANALFSTPNDMLLGQRKWGLTYSNSIWGMGVCGTSELGEIFAVATPDALGDTNKSAMSAFSCFYNTFIEVETDGDIKWKKVPGSIFNNGNDGVPWIHDRRFRLFYLYPTMLALNTTIVDYFHDGVGYYNHLNKSGWFDKTLNNKFRPSMETIGNAPVVSNFPFPNRKTPTKPPQNFWTGYARTSEFELLYACMKGGITTGLDSLYFNELHEELVNGLIDPPDTSRTGFFRALDFAVWGVSWTPAATGPDGQSLYPSIVPMLHVDNTPGVDLNYFRYRDGPGSTAGMTFTSDTYSDIFGAHKRLAAQIPYERRMLKPQYWLIDGPPGFHREPHYYFKKLTDGTTYTGAAGGLTFLSTEFGGTWGAFTDTNPIRFLTPWAYENRSVAKQSFLNFLSQAKNDGMLFKYLHDDSEAWGDQFAVAGPYLSRTDLGSTAALLNWANDPNNNFKVIPDARQTYAIVNDARFNGIISSITNRTFAQEFKHWYDGLTYMDPNGFAGACGASAEALLSYFTNVASRQDFKNAYQSDETRQTAFAWSTALYVFTQGDLKSKIIGDSLRETPGFENTIVTSSEVHEMTSAEARYGVDSGGLSRVAIKLTGYGHSHHLYAEMADYLTRDYGYPPSVSSDESIRFGKRFGFHPVSEGGITFGNKAYQGFIHNQKKVRAILRSRPQAYSEGLNFLITAGPQDAFNSSVGFTGPLSEEYYKEDIFHSCLAGTNQFIVFNTRGTAGKDLSRVNAALVEWREISGNKVAVPCNSTGATGATVDRIDLYQAGTNSVISGAMTDDPNKRLWRLTAPAGKNVFVKQGTSQPNLPDTISIASGERGVWLEAPASYGVPVYQSQFNATPDYYTISVSSMSGDDASDGVSSPVQTIGRALNIAASYTDTLPIIIDMMPGVYELFGETVEFNSTHSGEADKPLTIRATQQDSVIITGAKTLDVAGVTLINSADPMYERFKPSVRGSIYKVNLNDGNSFGMIDVGVFGNIRYTQPIYPIAGVTVDVYNGRRLGFKDIPTLPEISFNGEPLTLARFPSIATGAESSEFSFDSSAIIESVIESGSGSAFTSPGFTFGVFRYPSGVCYGIDYSGITRWSDRVGPNSDIYVHGFWRFDWNDEAYRIDSINTATRNITVRSSDSAYGIAGVTSCTSYVPANPSPRRWFALNVPEELDNAGEYYISRNRLNSGSLTSGLSDTLYFIPPVGITSGTKIRVSSSRTSSGVDWTDGTPEYDALKIIQTKDPSNTRDTLASMFKLYRSDNIVIDGLIFDTCSGSAVEINQCNNVVVKNCKIRNMRKNGVVILDGTTATVDNCDIRNIGLKGIILTGGNRQTLSGSGNVVSNCVIKSFGRLSSSNGAAIQMSGVGNIIQKTLIADGNGKGIDYSGNNNIIESNNFTNLNFYNDDMGAVYKYADPSHVGNVIRGNFFNNIGSRLPGGPYYGICGVDSLHNACAIYFDYSGGGDNIIRNVFYRCGSTMSDVDNAIFIGGTNIKINNNIFIECTRPSTFVKFNEGNWNSLWKANGLKYSTFNIDGDEWLERSSTIPTTDRRYGYTPYSYYETNYGEATMQQGNSDYFGLYNKVDIRNLPWVSQYPHLTSIMSFDGTNIQLNLSQINNPSNLVIANNNVCIGTTTGATYAFFEKVYSASGTLYGGFTIGGITFASVAGGSGWFLNYGNKDFKLSSSGLQAIKQSLPQFADIAFENIPIYS